ncbi:hypothetical protein AK812_SmicGene10725 [Symbiodinium microadriaticum]|uniref:Uncharacterized protein n=1 Tax=Symbiodinium microadriaticum TaxID=2951 RepID=A0A1Q9EF60_SYMMI|nr:hypothetical protein AK812_SmicGene10725 [Symbiodinium microadriaticum]
MLVTSNSSEAAAGKQLRCHGLYRDWLMRDFLSGCVAISLLVCYTFTSRHLRFASVQPVPAVVKLLSCRAPCPMALRELRARCFRHTLCWRRASSSSSSHVACLEAVADHPCVDTCPCFARYQPENWPEEGRVLDSVLDKYVARQPRPLRMEEVLAMKDPQETADMLKKEIPAQDDPWALLASQLQQLSRQYAEEYGLMWLASDFCKDRDPLPEILLKKTGFLGGSDPRPERKLELPGDLEARSDSEHQYRKSPMMNTKCHHVASHEATRHITEKDDYDHPQVKRHIVLRYLTLKFSEFVEKPWLRISSGGSGHGSPCSDGRRPELLQNTGLISMGLKDPEFLVRSTACSALQKLPPEALLEQPDLLRACLDDEEAMVRRAACKALWTLDPLQLEPFVDIVAVRLTDADLLVRWTTGKVLERMALPTLQQLAPALARGLDHGDLALRASCADALSRIEDADILSPLAPQLASCLEDLSWKVRFHACKALARCEAAAVSPFGGLLAAHLADPDARARVAACEALAACEEWSVTPAATLLADCFQDEDPQLVVAAFRAFAQIKGAACQGLARCRAALLAAQLGDADVEIRIAVCQAMAKLNPAKISPYVPLLAKRLKDTLLVRWNALRALVECKPGELIPHLDVLTELTGDHNKQVQSLARRAVARCYEPKPRAP